MDKEKLFKSTRWTEVQRAGLPCSAGHAGALSALCRDYRGPIFQFARYWLPSTEDAEDLTQSFFCHFIERNLPGAASQEHGRFRTFLLACFKNFLRDEWRRRQRGRKIPEKLITSLDPVEKPQQHPAAAVPSVDEQIDQLWAKTVWNRTVRSLEKEYAENGELEFLKQTKALLEGRELEKSYVDLASDLQISVGALKMKVLRLRKAFRERFLEAVTETVTDDGQAEEESKYLLSLVFVPEQTM